MTTPILRVYSDHDDVPNPLQVAFERLKLPQLQQHGRAADTIRQYRLSVRKWCDFFALQHRTTSPVLSAIRTEDLEAWRVWLIGRGDSNRTANKCVGDVRSILRRAAEVGRDELAVVAAPTIRRLSQRIAAPKLYFNFLTEPEQRRLEELRAQPSPDTTTRARLARLKDRDELSRLYDAAAAATWPTRSITGTKIDPVAHWRAAIVLWCSYGFRTEELIAYSAGNSPIAWSQVHWSPESPAAACHARSPHGWIWYVPQKQRARKPEPLCLPLSEPAGRHLRAIQPESIDPAAPVFPWPLYAERFYREWERIISLAGFARKLDLTSGQVIERRIKHLRITCVTWHDYYDPGLGEHITGHAARSISATHYTNFEKRLVRAFRRLPVPEAWRAPSPEASRAG